MEKKQPTLLLECALKLKIGQASQEAEAVLTDSILELRPKFSNPLTYSYRDFTEIRAEDYKVILNAGDEDLQLYHLGSKYDDFVRILFQQRNEQILNDLLMQESVRRAGIIASCTRQEAGGEDVRLGNCELRLCDTALLILPEQHRPIRLLFSFVKTIKEEGYSLHLETEAGVTYTFSKLGREFTPFAEDLSQAMNELSAKSQALLRDLTPTAAPAAIHLAAQLMREGRAVKRRELEKIDPAMWKGLERQLDATGIRQEYVFLNSLASTEQQCIGFKRELVAQTDTEYIWFLIPIVNSNVIAMEATSGPQTGRATYFFRIVSRAEFSALGSQELYHHAEEFLANINRCMLAINFRREPIYLPEEKLDEPRYFKYRQAVVEIPELRELRRHFVGRIFHREPEQWQTDIKDLLRFNTSTRDDKAKWTKSDLATPEETGREELDIENGG